MENENIKVEKNNKKVILSLGIVLSVFIVLIFSATYAYFSVNTTNNFGNTTIDATAESTGTVALNGTSASLRLDLSAADMMQGTGDITYWGTADGTPSTTQNVVTIGSTEVTGAGYFNCNYTLSVTATATNNMYTAFQGMTGKSEEQIVLKIGDTKYDFNTPNLFPITVNGTLNGLTSSSSKSLTAEFYLVNKEGVIQDALEYKDLSIAITATNFSCTAVEGPQETVAYYTYDANATSGPNGMITAKSDAPNSSWQYYVTETSSRIVASDDEFVIAYGDFLSESACKNDNHYINDVDTPCVKKSDEKYTILVMETKTTSQSACEETLPNLPSGCVCSNLKSETYTKVTKEVCAVFNNSSDGTVCLKPNDYENVDSYYEKMHNLGLACNNYQNNVYLQCSNGSLYTQSDSLNCSMNRNDDSVSCGFYGVSSCIVYRDGSINCNLSK